MSNLNPEAVKALEQRKIEAEQKIAELTALVSDINSALRLVGFSADGIIRSAGDEQAYSEKLKQTK